MASKLAIGLDRADHPIPVIYGNSIHSTGDSVFGAAKRDVAATLFAAGQRNGAAVVDVVLPNILGEFGRPFYN